MTKTVDKNIIFQFREWLKKKGYTDSTAYTYSTQVGRILRDIGIDASEYEIKQLLSSINCYTRTNYVTAWNRFKEFLNGGVRFD